MDLSLPHASCFLSRNEDRQLHPLEERLKQTASSDAEKEISRILDDVDRLSDKDKLLLYLKMPVGEKAQRNCCSLDSVSTTKMNNVQRSKVEAQQWLRANYEELQNCSVGRQEVYDHYRKSCELANARALNQQDFGKVVKHVFRSVTYRRLGNRSNSKFHYVGIRRLSNCQPPRLSSLDMILSHPSKHSVYRADHNEKTTSTVEHQAAERVVLKYINGLVTSCFTNVIDAAKHLLLNHYVTADSLDVSILNCQSVVSVHTESKDQEDIPYKHKDENVTQEQSRSSGLGSIGGQSRRHLRSTSDPTGARPTRESLSTRPASLPADLLSNTNMQQTPHIDVRFKTQQRAVTHTQTVSPAQTDAPTQISRNSCSSMDALPLTQLANSESSTTSLPRDLNMAAEFCDEQRRPKFADTLQEIAQERCVEAGKAVATMSRDLLHSSEGNGIHQRKRRVRFQDVSLQSYSKQPILTESHSVYNSYQHQVGQSWQPFVVQDSTSVASGNDLPIDRSRYEFIPIPMCLSPLEQSVQHASHSSPINEILGITGQPPDASDVSIRCCRLSGWSSVANRRSKEEMEFQRPSLKLRVRKPVTVGNVGTLERLIQPSCMENPKYPSTTQQPCNDLSSSPYHPPPSSYDSQPLSYTHALSYNPPPSYDQAVAHIMDDKLTDNMGTTSQHTTASFPVDSLSNISDSNGIHLDSFLDVSSTALSSVESYYEQGISSHEQSTQCLTKQIFSSLDHMGTNPSCTRYAGHALLPWSLSNGQNLNGSSAFRQVPPSTQSAHRPITQCKSPLVHRSGDEGTSALTRTLLSPFGLLPSVTENNDDETSQECSGYSSSISSAADDVQPWVWNTRCTGSFSSIGKIV